MRTIGLALCVAGAAATAQPLPAQTFAADAEPGFKPVLPALEAYLDAQTAPAAGTQHFCVVGYRRGEDRYAWVYWQQGQRLVYWEPAADDVESKETLTRSRRELNLRKDVVASARELRGSSYRVDRPWLNRLLTDCRHRGQAFDLRRP
jgi:hypothetical protein